MAAGIPDLLQVIGRSSAYSLSRLDCGFRLISTARDSAALFPMFPFQLQTQFGDHAR